MMLDLCWSGLVSTACCSVCWGGGCGTLGLVGGGMVGTLLGPEASGPCLFACLVAWSWSLWGPGVWWWGVWVGVVLVVSCVSSFVLCRVFWCGGLVGLLFEICIVDASIN